MGFVNERDENRKWRTVDQDKDLILEEVYARGPDEIYEFEFKINGHVIRFSGVSREKYHQAYEAGEYHKYDMDWYFDRLYVPKELQNKKEEIAEEITNALKVYGWAFVTERAYSVSVTFKPELLA